jgi:hypothetical protein
MSIFGTYQDAAKPYSFYGTSGFWSVPGGRTYYMAIDKGMQNWVSPNPITKNADGTVSGDPLYAAELNCDGTLVFVDAMANRQINIDSPPRDHLSQSM